MANDFYYDPTCKAQYRFEASYLLVDSQSDNHLFDHNTVSESSSDFKEGYCAASFSAASTQYFTCTNSELCEGFPLKWFDTPAERAKHSSIISFCFWVKFYDVTDQQNIVGKSSSADGCSFLCYSDNGQLTIDWGYNEGASFYSYPAGLTFNSDEWYHVGVSLDETDQIAYFHVWNDSAQEIICNRVQTLISEHLSTTSAPLSIGADGDGSNPLNAIVDEVVIFSTFKNSLDFDNIRQDIYKKPALNAFYTDPECVALYNFEMNPGFTQDSQGSNHLTQYNTVKQDLIYFKRDRSSAYFRANELGSLSILDSNLGADFPLKSGSASKKFSICLWFRIPGNIFSYMLAKGSTTNGKRSFAVYIDYMTPKIQWSYDGTNYDTYITYGLTYERWYHMGISLDGDSKYLIARIYDSVQQKVVFYESYNVLNELFLSDGPFTLGVQTPGTQYFKGWLDEVVVFNDVRTLFEIDRVREGTYFRNLDFAVTESSGSTVLHMKTAGIECCSSGVMVAVRGRNYFPANNYSADPTCIASFSFEEDPGTLVDSIGGNDLTDHGTIERVQ